MTLTIDISPETETQLLQEATRHGQNPEEFARAAFEDWLYLLAQKPDTEASYFEDMRAVSIPTLREYWDNEEDAVYDTFDGGLLAES